mmetsp:Transcript_1176/g.1192  ORF Transcript_1176/g.1192 Transcript_1176/m.1192 type:complete len:291 (+) Transcript_1176:65-937(+)
MSSPTYSMTTTLKNTSTLTIDCNSSDEKKNPSFVTNSSSSSELTLSSSFSDDGEKSLEVAMPSAKLEFQPSSQDISGSHPSRSPLIIALHSMKKTSSVAGSIIIPSQSTVIDAVPTVSPSCKDNHRPWMSTSDTGNSPLQKQQQHQKRRHSSPTLNRLSGRNTAEPPSPFLPPQPHYRNRQTSQSDRQIIRESQSKITRHISGVPPSVVSDPLPPGLIRKTMRFDLFASGPKYGREVSVESNWEANDISTACNNISNKRLRASPSSSKSYSRPDNGLYQDFHEQIHTHDS